MHTSSLLYNPRDLHAAITTCTHQLSTVGNSCKNSQQLDHKITEGSGPKQAKLSRVGATAGLLLTLVTECALRVHNELNVSGKYVYHGNVSYRAMCLTS